MGWEYKITQVFLENFFGGQWRLISIAIVINITLKN